jgi:hypothetical protein
MLAARGVPAWVAGSVEATTAAAVDGSARLVGSYR